MIHSLKGLSRLNQFERKIFKIAKIGGKKVRLIQLGLSSLTGEGFQFPIYSLEIGTPKAIRQRPVGLVAGIHGLETIGIQILLNLLENILNVESPCYMQEIKNGDIGIVSIPIVNPGGIAVKSRSNPLGVDLMRNSGIKAERPLFFFGGQTFSDKLPFFQGKGLEIESKIFMNFIDEYFFGLSNNSLAFVLDIHSGFGFKDRMWWPYAFTKEKCPDDLLYRKMADYLRNECKQQAFIYEPQSKNYTTNGDLWDKAYIQFQEGKKKMMDPKFLPWTLEIGTWNHIKARPQKIFKKRALFNPHFQDKKSTFLKYRKFLKDFIRMSMLDHREILR